jgi:menaquinone-specific isochorismate synthase
MRLARAHFYCDVAEERRNVLYHIVNYTIPCRPSLLTDFLRFGAGMERFYFESSQSSIAIAGLGIAAQIRGSGGGLLDSLGAAVDELFQNIVSVNQSKWLPRPTLLGGGAFFEQMQPGEWSSFPSAALVLPRYAVIRIGEEYFFSVNQASAEKDALRVEAESVLGRFESAILPPPSMPDEIIQTETACDEWKSAVSRLVEMIDSGALKKVVLARPLQVTGNRAVDVSAMLAHLGEACPACFRFMFEFSAGTAFAGATPERLIAVQNGKFSTAAIAGSIRRGEFPGEDEALGAQLLSSAKDQSEHAFVLEHIREQMLPFAEELRIAPQPTLLRLPNIFHLQTRIDGTLHPRQNILKMVSALHPTPAVGGVPREAALHAIRQFEGFERGWYAAPVGWVDANGDGDFVVAIRSGLFHNNHATLFSGAGIVAHSDPQKEWEETAVKMRFLLEAMQCEVA